MLDAMAIPQKMRAGSLSDCHHWLIWPRFYRNLPGGATPKSGLFSMGRVVEVMAAAFRRFQKRFFRAFSIVWWFRFPNPDSFNSRAAGEMWAGRGAFMQAVLTLIRGETVEKQTFIPFKLVTPRHVGEFMR